MLIRTHEFQRRAVLRLKQVCLIEPMGGTLARVPEEGSRGQEIRRRGDRFEAIEIEIVQARRGCAKNDADVLWGAVEEVGGSLRVDPEGLPLFEEQALRTERNRDGLPAALEVVAKRRRARRSWSTLGQICRAHCARPAPGVANSPISSAAVPRRELPAREADDRANLAVAGEDLIPGR